MNKKVLIGFLVVIVGIALFAFTSDNPQGPSSMDDDKKVVLTTFTVLQDIAQNVAGDVLDVRSITKTGADIHAYEPTPSDLVQAQAADLILDNGMNLELWAEGLYESIPDVPTVRVTEGIEPLPIAEGSYEGRANPHAWMSPQLALQYVENIRKAFVTLSPENEATFNANAAAYSEQIMALDTKLEETLAVLPENQRALVTCEGAFTYLTEDYDLQEVYMWPINSDANGTPQQIASVINAVRENNIPTVYCESTVSTEPMEQVAREAGATFGGVFYVDSLSEADGPAPTYLDLLTYNVETLIAGWEK